MARTRLHRPCWSSGSFLMAPTVYGHPAHDEGEPAAGAQGPQAPPRGVVPVIGIGLHSPSTRHLCRHVPGHVLTGPRRPGHDPARVSEGVLTFVILSEGAYPPAGDCTGGGCVHDPGRGAPRLSFIDRLDPGALGATLAISGGALVYVGLHLLSQVAHEGRRRNCRRGAECWSPPFWRSRGIDLPRVDEGEGPRAERRQAPHGGSRCVSD